MIKLDRFNQLISIDGKFIATWWGLNSRWIRIQSDREALLLTGQHTGIRLA